MATKRPIEFANFVCKFGNKVMMDYAQEIVIPAFKKEGRYRKYGDNRFFLTDVHLFAHAPKDEPVLGVICGRFIKDTILSRDQYWDEKSRRLIKDKRAIQAAPSAIFALILNHHKLLYLHETPYAPTLKMFETTIRQFLDKAHKEYLMRIRKETPFAEVDPPILHITPLPSEESVRDYLERFAILKHAEFEMAFTNNNLEAEDFFKEQRVRAQKMKSKKAKISYDNPKGLDKTEAARQIGQAAAEGVNKIQIRGTDMHGDILTGTNEEIKVRAEIEVEPGVEDIKPVAGQMTSKFRQLTDQGTIKAAKPTASENSTVKRFLQAIHVLPRPNGTN